VSSVASPASDERPGGLDWASDPGRATPGAGRLAGSARHLWLLIEAAALLAAPGLAFAILRLRPMAPPGLPDPSISSTYIFAPRDYFYRFETLFSPTARMREGARVGFLVPARLAYLAFGAVPGFFVLRYLLALVAVVPAYLLLRRLYGLGAGAVAVAVIMSSPVMVTAWGTDFPDAAVVSYLIGGLACLVMPAAGRRARLAWLAGSAFLFTMAVWSLATSAVFVAVVLAAYLTVRLLRDRTGLVPDVAVLAGAAAVVTAGLAPASAATLSQWNYVTPTIDAVRFLAKPAQEALWHSANWRWAPYRSYVLVPPAVALACIVVLRRWRQVGPAQLAVGLGAVVAVVVAFLLQFADKVQILEEHYFYSTLWSTLLLGLIVVLAELTRPLASHRLLQWVPAALVVAAALLYETDPHVPAFGWAPVGFILAGALVVVAGVAHRLVSSGRLPTARLAGGTSVVAIVGLALVLTVAPYPRHPVLPGTIYDPPTGYASALGGSATLLIDNYRITSEIRAFVGNATYKGEHVLTCLRTHDSLTDSALGVFHSGFDQLSNSCPRIDRRAALALIKQRRAGQVLAMSERKMRIRILLRELAPLQPFVVRSTVLRSGRQRLHLWLIEIPRYLRPS
jgi:hypothetical protein